MTLPALLALLGLSLGSARKDPAVVDATHEACRTGDPADCDDQFLWGLPKRVRAIEYNFEKLIAEGDEYYRALGAVQGTLADALHDLDVLGKRLDDHVQSVASTRRDVAVLTGFVDGRPTYAVLTVHEVGGASDDAVFTVDLAGVAGDVQALIAGTVAEPCARIFKDAEPYVVSGKPALLCLAPAGATGPTPTSTVGITYLSAADAYEMFTGTRLVFSPYAAPVGK